MKMLLALMLMVGACGHGSSQCMNRNAKPYFPYGTVGSTGNLYSAHLCAMEERPLRSSAATRTYRLLLLRKCDHPLSIRIESDGTKATMGVVEMDGTGESKPGKILWRKECPMEPDEWRALEDAITDSGFWETPTNEGKAWQGVDNSQWVLEGYQEGTYHVVARLSPESGPFRAAGEALFRARLRCMPKSQAR